MQKKSVNANLDAIQHLLAAGALDNTDYRTNLAVEDNDPFHNQSIWARNAEEEEEKSTIEQEKKQDRSEGIIRVNASEHFVFWMDTLCIPKNELSTDNTPNRPSLRKKAITEMTDVYEQAESVLVLDAQLRQVSLAVTHTELMGRIMMSGWMRRLWTYQEGIVSRSLDFRLSDGSLNFESASLFAKISSNIVLQDTFQKFPAGENVVWIKSDRFLMLRKIADSFAWRSLSKPGDEVLVLCLLLHMSRDEIKRVMDLPREESMQKFWATQRRVPRGIIIWQGPRLQVPGFRWAPSTFLKPQKQWRDLPPFTPAEIHPQGSASGSRLNVWSNRGLCLVFTIENC